MVLLCIVIQVRTSTGIRVEIQVLMVSVLTQYSCGTSTRTVRGISSDTLGYTSTKALTVQVVAASVVRVRAVLAS